MLTTGGQFGGSAQEDLHLHLKSFLDVCNKFVILGVIAEKLQIIISPNSCGMLQRCGLNSQLAGSITTWAELTEKFMEKYFPPTTTSKLQLEIMIFTQQDDESLSDAWERLKGYSRDVCIIV